MKQNELVRAVASLGVVGAVSFFSSLANASGFALVEQSVKQVGSAISGGAASAEDATTIYFNPAGMTRIKGTQYAAALHVVQTSSKFSGGATLSPAVGGGPISPAAGADPSGGDAGETGLIPNFYYVRDISDTMKFGFGMGAPFGLTTDYSDGWVGRYHALKSELKTVNFNPSLAWKINDKLSLGAGINAMYAQAELSNAIDFGSIGAALSIPGSMPGSAAQDGKATVEGDDWGYGFNLGLLYQATMATRIGVAYRSSVEQKVEGTADFELGSGPGPTISGATGQFVDTTATASVDLPETLSISVYHDINPKWSFMGDLTWTKWSRFDELRVQFGNPAQADSVTPENWDDTYKLSLGATYRRNDEWTWRGGVAYDQTPIQNAQDRTPRIPGNDRTWLAVGFTYTRSSNLEFDFAFAHLLIDDTPIDNTIDSSLPVLTHNLNGTYEADVNIVSAQLTWKF